MKTQLYFGIWGVFLNLFLNIKYISASEILMRSARSKYERVGEKNETSSVPHPRTKCDLVPAKIFMENNRFF